MSWASDRSTIDELKSLPRTRGVGTLIFGAACMLSWTAASFYSPWKPGPRLLEALLWTGEVLFFWGCGQYLYWGVRRVWRQSRTGDRRVPRPGRRRTDSTGEPDTESHPA